MAALDPVSRCHARARQHLSGTQRQGSSACAELQGGGGAGRTQAGAAGELRAGAHHSASRHEDRSGEGADRRRRSARRPRPRHRWHEARQPDRRGARSRSRLLLHRVPSQPDARADDRGCLSRRGDVRRGCGGAAPGCGWQTDRHRQLPGGLADHDDGGDLPQPDRADHAGRFAAVLLGRRARQEPDALPRWPARRHLADDARRRHGQWHFRRRQSGRQLRVAKSRQHLLDQGLQRLFEGGYREGRASSNSRLGGAVLCC